MELDEPILLISVSQIYKVFLHSQLTGQQQIGELQQLADFQLHLVQSTADMQF